MAVVLAAMHVPRSVFSPPVDPPVCALPRGPPATCARSNVVRDDVPEPPQPRPSPLARALLGLFGPERQIRIGDESKPHGRTVAGFGPRFKPEAVFSASDRKGTEQPNSGSPRWGAPPAEREDAGRPPLRPATPRPGRFAGRDTSRPLGPPAPRSLILESPRGGPRAPTPRPIGLAPPLVSDCPNLATEKRNTRKTPRAQTVCQLLHRTRAEYVVKRSYT